MRVASRRQRREKLDRSHAVVVVETVSPLLTKEKGRNRNDRCPYRSQLPAMLPRRCPLVALLASREHLSVRTDRSRSNDSLDCNEIPSSFAATAPWQIKHPRVLLDTLFHLIYAPTYPVRPPFAASPCSLTRCTSLHSSPTRLFASSTCDCDSDGGGTPEVAEGGGR
jgi:hypothetical protein